MIIGAGGVTGVTAHKCALNDNTFSEMIIASRTKSKCDALKAEIQKRAPLSKTKIITEKVDANNTKNLIKLIKKHKPQIVLHLALPYKI